MECPKCGDQVKVIDSRVRQTKTSEGIIYRRRKCPVCNFRFSTFEITEARLKILMSAQIQLKAMRDMMSGADSISERPKLNSVPKALEYLVTKG